MPQSCRQDTLYVFLEEWRRWREEYRLYSYRSCEVGAEKSGRPPASKLHHLRLLLKPAEKPFFVVFISPLVVYDSLMKSWEMLVETDESV